MLVKPVLAVGTELIVFGFRQNCRGMDPINIRLREDSIHESPTYSISSDTSYSTSPHIGLARICTRQKCNGILIGLPHVRHHIPLDFLPTSVSALVLPLVRYFLAFFGNGTEKSILRLRKILKFALRLISGRRQFDRISDVRDEPGLSTASHLYKCHSHAILHKIRCTGNRRLFHLNLWQTPVFVPGIRTRMLNSPSLTRGLKRVDGASFLT